MALGSLWARARSQPVFLRQFSAYMIGLATWVPAIIWFNTNVAEITVIDGPSMYPFLNDGINRSLRRDLVLNYKLYAQDNLARGMVVTFRYDTPPSGAKSKLLTLGLER
jgi:inner membrane protease subunit 2